MPTGISGRVLPIRHDRETGMAVRIITDSETGRRAIVQRQNLTPILDDAKRAAGAFDPYAVRKNAAGIRRVASIPVVVVAQLKARGIWQDRKRLLRWLSDPENRAFRTDDGGKLG